jgi:hypothetical protein
VRLFLRKIGKGVPLHAAYFHFIEQVYHIAKRSISCGFYHDKKLIIVAMGLLQVLLNL